MRQYYVSSSKTVSEFFNISRAMFKGYEKSLQENPNSLKTWLLCGQPKIVLKVESLSQIEELYKQANELGIVAAIVRDAGKTQVSSNHFVVNKFISNYLCRLLLQQLQH